MESRVGVLSLDLESGVQTWSLGFRLLSTWSIGTRLGVPTMTLSLEYALGLPRLGGLDLEVWTWKSRLGVWT